MTVELHPRIVVFGVGGAGSNAVNNMIDANLQGVEFIVANTDAQALARAKTENRIQLGLNTTQGLGAGAKPEIGAAAAEESLEDISSYLAGTHMAFVAAGMGGGTGTGSAPVIARCARERGILTIGVVTKPFSFEGTRRMRLAEEGLEELRAHVDTLIVIPNQNLFRIANDKTTFAEAFQMADRVLYSGVRGITDLMVMPGLINLDFADVRTIIAEMGAAMMGTGEAEGEKRALEAAQSAITNPLLDDVSMKGAKGVLINITGGYDMTLYEVDEAANAVRAEVDQNAHIILGSTFDETLEGRMRVSVVATGITLDPNTEDQDIDKSCAESVDTSNRTIIPEKVSEAPILALQPQSEKATDDVPASSNEAMSSNTLFSNMPSVSHNQNQDDIDSSISGLFGFRNQSAEQLDNELADLDTVNPVDENNIIKQSSDDCEDDLEIPAFLRRSTGS